MKLLITSLFLLAGFSAQANDEGYLTAVVTADRMTCEQAIQTYEKCGRIYVIAHGKDIVPIYGKTPVSKARSFRCTGRGQNKWVYTVKTLDNRRCGIAVYCQ